MTFLNEKIISLLLMYTESVLQGPIELTCSHMDV